MDYNYQAYPWGRWIKWGVIALVVVILLGILGSSYNGLVKADNEVQTKWSQVENIMQERFDKISSMINFVEKNTEHEEKIVSEIARARAAMGDFATSAPGDINSKSKADERVTNSLKNLYVILESYPTLGSGNQFHDLIVAEDEVENKLAVERKRFIDSVNDYNLKVKTFPGNIFAKFLGYGPKEYYKAAPEALKPPKFE